MGKVLEKYSRGTLWVSASALILLTLITYFSVLQSGFIWDDDYYVTENQTLKSLEGLKQIWTERTAVPQYYPMVHTTFWVEYHLWGLHPAGYHLVNVFLHAATGVLLWSLLRSLQVPGAWLASALFLLHPIQVESVAWITERKNVLSGFFYMLAATSYLRFVNRSISRGRDTWLTYILSLALFVLALLSKTVACSLPAAILLVLWWKKKLQAKNVYQMVPFFLIGIYLGLQTAQQEVAHVVGGEAANFDFSFLERCLIAGRALCFYLGKVFLPFPLMFNYPRWVIDTAYWWQYLFPAGVLLVITGLLVAGNRLGRGPLTAALYYLGTLFPALGFFNLYPMKYSFVADHFQYLAGIGVYIPVATGIMLVTARSNQVRRLASGTLLAVLAVLTFIQIADYRDLRTLWTNTLRKNPQSWMSTNNLGHVYEMEGELEQALAYFDQTILLNPDYSTGYYNKANILARMGKLDEALSNYERAVDIEPRYDKSHINYGNALAVSGRVDEALLQFDLALKLNPEQVDATYNKAVILLKTGHREEAIRLLQRALKLDPNYARALNKLKALGY